MQSGRKKIAIAFLFNFVFSSSKRWLVTICTTFAGHQWLRIKVLLFRLRVVRKYLFNFTEVTILAQIDEIGKYLNVDLSKNTRIWFLYVMFHITIFIMLMSIFRNLPELFLYNRGLRVFTRHVTKSICTFWGFVCANLMSGQAGRWHFLCRSCSLTNWWIWRRRARRYAF